MWERVEEIFKAAVEADPARRSSVVDVACGEDAEVRRQVEALLRAHDVLEKDAQFTLGIADTLDPVLSMALLESAPCDLDPGDQVGRYRIVRRAASGGMGVVYLAHDDRLDRAVALKLLPIWRSADPEANSRLEDEARAASALDHPNLATVYEIGESEDGRLFIAMPWYEGGTLRDRLEGRGLSISEACSIGAQIADGLAAAHRRGVVHRDIKPENIAFGRGDRPAVVDFGIASATRRRSTSVGLEGTVAYMSPEQSRSGPVDGRTDIWSLGVVLYEMVAGRRPFSHEDRAALVKALQTEEPLQLDVVRPGVPTDLAALVSRCLEKNVDRRLATADELAGELRRMARTSRPNTTETHAIRRTSSAGSVWQVATVYLVASWLAYRLSIELTGGLGLPGWVPGAALVLLLIGLPVVTLTSLSQLRLRRGDRAGPFQESRFLRRLTWSRSLGAGVLAFGLLGAGVVGYSGMRTLGIGPLATLESRGLIDQREPILLADFATHASDDMLGRVVTEALRIDLHQSPTLQLAETRALADALLRMGREPGDGMPEEVAIELAEREGYKAVITGDVNAIGGSFVLTARVLSAVDGSVLTAIRETARDSSALIDAVDRLSKRVRERIGEPLRALHVAEPLPRVATASLPALRKYAEGARLATIGGDDSRIAALMEEAVAIDSTFATAYRSLSVTYWNLRVDHGRIVNATRRAYELRDRLPERERLMVEATYYTHIVADMERAGRVFGRVLEIDPNDMSARNNYALSHLFGGRPVEAEAILRAAPPNAPAMLRLNLADALLFQDRADDALAALDEGVVEFGESPLWAITRMRILGADWRWDEAEATARTAMIDHADNAQVRTQALRTLWHLALLRGRMQEAEEYFAQLIPEIEAADATELLARVRLQRAEVWLTLLGDADRARDEVLSIMAEMDLLSAGAVIAPRAAATLAGAGATQEAANLLRAWEAQPAEMRAHISYYSEEKGWARLAMRDGDLDTAIARLEAAAADPVNYINIDPDLAHAYQLAGRPDRAAATLERYLFTKHSRWVHRVPPYVGPSLMQLGEAYEEVGERERAAEAYRRLVDLWRDADAELQPHVEHAAGRLAALLEREADRLGE